jgi:Ca2+-binding RTX toxin-like protein
MVDRSLANHLSPSAAEGREPIGGPQRAARSRIVRQRPAIGSTSFQRRRLTLQSLEPRQLLAADSTSFVGPIAFGLRAMQADSGFVMVHEKQTDGPLAKSLGYDVASLLGEYRQYLEQPTAEDFEPSQSLLNVDPDRGTLTADVQVQGSMDAFAQVVAERGGMVRGSYGELATVTLPIDQWEMVAASPQFGYIASAYRPIRSAGGTSNQADQANRTESVRVGLGFSGTDVAIGVMSDSFDTGPGSYANDITSGDLPAGINVVEEYTSAGSDEGRAMLQLIHDLAPGSPLLFHTAFLGQASFAQGITDLRNAGADVIVDDVYYLSEPYYMDGIIAQSVDASYAAGVPYFSSAGNNGRNSYEQSFRASTTYGSGAFGAGFFGGRAHDFDPGAGTDTLQSFSVSAGSSVTLVLQWDQPFNSHTTGNVGASSDIDFYILDGNNQVVVSSVNDNLNGDAVEIVTVSNTTASTQTYQALVVVYDGPTPNLIKYVEASQRGFAVLPEYFTFSSTITGHANAVGAAAVGASNYSTSPYYDTAGKPPTVEGFSSRGTTEVKFNTAGDPWISPRANPDFVAANRTNTSVPGFSSFAGTSAAAPHAAAVAALLIDAEPTLTPATIYSVMAETAIDMDNPNSSGFDVGWDLASGAGMVHAMGAVRRVLGAPPQPTNSIVLELNPFGDVTLAGAFTSGSGLQSYRFTSNVPGTVNLSATESDTPLDLGIVHWSFDRGYLGESYDRAQGDQTPALDTTVSGDERMQWEVFQESTDADGGPFTVAVNGPDQQSTDLSVPTSGQGSAAGNLATIGAVDYFKLLLPASVTSPLTIGLQSAFDGVLTLFDASGATLARADVAAAGQTETIQLNTIVASGTYYARVAPRDESTGTYSLTASLGSSDVLLNSATVSGSSLTVSYSIVGSNLPSLGLSVVRSSDSLAGGDVAVDTITITDSAQLSAGSHTVVLALGSAATQIALPGAGVADVDDDYSLLAILDPSNTIVESDSDPLNEDNTRRITGHYNVAGDALYYFGSDEADSISLTVSGSNLRLRQGSLTLATFPTSTVASFRARMGGGNDRTSITPTLNLPTLQHGGAGADTLVGAAAVDRIFGGLDNDSLNGRSGNDSIDGQEGSDTWTFSGTEDVDDLVGDLVAGQLEVTRRDGNAVLQETDRAIRVERVTVRGEAGNDTIDFSLLALADRIALGITSVTLDGNAGSDLITGSNGRDTLRGGLSTELDVDTIYGRGDNDTIYGGGGNDLLYGEDGNDTVRGEAGDDRLDGGLGTDRLEGGDGTDLGRNGETLTSIEGSW